MTQIKIEISGSGTLDQVATRLIEIGRGLQIISVHGGEVPTGETEDSILVTKIEIEE
jgi:hypothetical protein